MSMQLMFNAAEMRHSLKYMHEYGVNLEAPQGSKELPQPYRPYKEAGPPPEVALPPQYHYAWKYDLGRFKQTRDDYIKRLNAIYASNLEKAGISVYQGYGSLQDAHTIRVHPSTDLYTGKSRENVKVVGADDNVEVRGENIVLAPGGYPSRMDIPGQELTIDSDGFFELDKIPSRVTVVGAGYIATELAGILNMLGSQVSIVIRGDNVLRKFDVSMQPIR